MAALSSGATLINAGSIEISAAERIRNGSAVTIRGRGALDLNDFAETGQACSSGRRSVALGDVASRNSLTMGGNNTSTTYSA